MRICARRNLFKYQFINVHYTATAVVVVVVVDAAAAAVAAAATTIQPA